MRGPHWTLYPAHSNTPLHGSSYLVIPTRVSCATAKNYVKRLFAKNTSWPYARSRTSSMTLKGGPKGYRCESSVESRRNRRAYAGRCIYPGTGPQDFREFHWAPDVALGVWRPYGRRAWSMPRAEGFVVAGRLGQTAK